MNKGRKTGTDTTRVEEYQKASALVKDKFCSKKALGRPFFVHSLDEQRMDIKIKTTDEALKKKCVTKKLRAKNGQKNQKTFTLNAN